MSCFDCRFYSKDGCAVNPSYRKAWGTVQRDTNLKALLLPLLQDCPSREAPKDLIFEFKLSEIEWRYMVESDRLLPRHRQQIAESLGVQINSYKDDSFDPIPF